MITDIVYTWSIRHIAKGNALQAASGNALLTTIGLVATWTIIQNNSLPEALIYVCGCFVGTFITIYKKRK